MQFETCNKRVFEITLAHATSGWVDFVISLFLFHIFDKKKVLARTRLESCFVIH
mgnify:FL=1